MDTYIKYYVVDKIVILIYVVNNFQMRRLNYSFRTHGYTTYNVNTLLIIALIGVYQCCARK